MTLGEIKKGLRFSINLPIYIVKSPKSTKGKPSERQGRKVTGLSPSGADMAAGLPSHLRQEIRFHLSGGADFCF
jgi:hypothetical protein